MGRWGERLFEGDADLDEAASISDDANIELLDYEPIKDHPDPTRKGLEATRRHLDSGVLDLMFDEYKTKKESWGIGKELRFVFLGTQPDPDALLRSQLTQIAKAALAMRVGATISPSNMDLVRSSIPKIQVSPKYSLAFCDSNFRGPAKVQIEGALARYKNDGTPYDFYADRCEGPHCGKAVEDLAGCRGLQKCGKCKEALYCSKECQTGAWIVHKKSCKTPEQQARQRHSILINV